jgi:Transposase DDE domain group 1
MLDAINRLTGSLRQLKPTKPRKPARFPLPPKVIVLDMHSSESPTYGEQKGSAYNGHFGCTCYHPLFVFNQGRCRALRLTARQRAQRR